MNNNSWDNGITKVHSLGEISKLMPALTPRFEVGNVSVETTEEPKEQAMQEQVTIKADPKEYAVRGSAWGSQRAKVAEALGYAKRHPEVALTLIAKNFDIKLQTLYSARYKTKMKVKDKMTKARAVKAEKKVNATTVPAWAQAAVSTSEKTIRETVQAKQDVVNHPAHYKTGGIETIDFIEAKQLTYNLGNVVKYITRAGIKDEAKHIEDLEKAAWYLNREIQNLKK